MSFTHLEVHSYYSLLAATAPVARLAARAAEQGLGSLALTDTDALYGAVAFAVACEEAGVQPIIGMTLTVARPAEIPAATGLPETGELVLLAEGPAGYRSLSHLTSEIQGHAERGGFEGADWDLLRRHHAGLTCISGGRRGWLLRYLAAGRLEAAQMYAGRLAGIFGEHACLGLEMPPAGDWTLGRELTGLAARLGLPAVALQPVYCLDAAEAARLRLLAAIRLNCHVDAVPASALPGDRPEPQPDDVRWLSPAEMAARFAGFPGLLAAAGEIASRCGPALPDGRPIWPALPLPAGQTPDQALAAAAEAGLRAHYGTAGTGPDAPAAGAPAEISARLDHELAAIARHGYAPLFLVVADIVRFARGQGIPVSTRGSVANSLVAYCTGITTVDPIEHGLLFERFLSPARADAPDIDMDLCSRRRDEVLAYVVDHYGADHVALVGTVSTLRLQSAVREAGKALGLDESRVNWLAEHLPRGWHRTPRAEIETALAELLATLDSPAERAVVEAAREIEGQPDHLSVHPGGVTMTPGPLADTVPVQWAPKGFLITQFEHDAVARLGLPKIDLLGVRALTVVADAAEMVRACYDPAFRLDAIPLDDPATRALLEQGDTIGVFQCESEGARSTLRKLRVRTVADLAIANAFFKPGPATGGMALEFVRRYRGERAVAYLHPALVPILGQTKGVLIFQEQILRIATEIAGLDWAQADHLRRGMSKFRGSEMAELHEQFVAGCQRPGPAGPGFTANQAETLWEQVAAFAGFGFNQGHATAYADVSYRCAYLKAHWPAAFMCARLADWGGFHHPAIYMAEAVRLGIAVRPPHVNHSGEHFTLDPGAAAGAAQSTDAGPAVLWMGLGQVRDLRSRAIEAIVAGRTDGPYTGVRDLLARVELHPKEVRHLIQCGALDGLGPSRTALLVDAGSIERAGGPQQMAFDFAEPELPGETLAQRLAWETAALGLPVDALGDPAALDALATRPTGTKTTSLVPLARLPATRGRPMTVRGMRLPGWTGGQGFFLSDGQSYVIVKTARGSKAPATWQPLTVRGRWTSDQWGNAWLQADEIS